MPRVRLNLNREWKFLRDDASGAERADFDDSKWQPIGLPHSFDLPYFRTPEFYVGYGWYRKTIALPENPGEGRVFLEFEGAFQVTELFVNGKPVGTHEGGYTGFSFDITDFLTSGENLLAVRVNNNWSPRIAPRAGEHIFSGGIYRDVYLVVTNPLHITWNGTFVTTPSVSHEAAIVNVKTEVASDSRDEKNATVRTEIVDSEGLVLAVMESSRSIAPGQIVEFDQTSESILNPRLWHPDHPNLYSVRSAVYDNEKRVDELESPLGFRWFKWTADQGFFLNGDHLYLRGANAHQDHSGWGIAITQAACERDVRLIKEAGMNFVRGAHYPHHPAFADACDRLGVLFWSENCFWGKGGFGPEGYWNASAYPVNPDDFKPFEESCKQTLREMIRINRNHPSIVVWSMTNEAFFTYNLDRARNLMSDLVAVSRKEDPTRPAAIGGSQRGDVDKLGDVAGYNGDGARLFINPGVPNMVSEYGAISKPPDVYDPFFGELQREPFPWRSGEAIWCGFDYGSIAGRQGLKGILDHARLPKRSWHWYRNEYLRIAPPKFPVDGIAARLILSADKATIQGTDATDDCQIIVTVCDENGTHVSNSPPVTLTIESGPGEFPTGRSITFDATTDIKITEGHAAIALRSYHGGQTIIRATSPGLADATITIFTEGAPNFVPCKTPPAPSRSYVPPMLSAAATNAMKNIVNVAQDRPSRASSELEDHPARSANDGNPATTWSASDENAGAWWMVDLEGFYQVSGSKLTFASTGNTRYLIEISQDRINWTVAVDRTETDRTEEVRNDIYPPGAVARYLRITFVTPAASLRDIEVYGVLSVR